MQFVLTDHLNFDIGYRELLAKYLLNNGYDLSKIYYQPNGIFGVWGYFFDKLNLESRIKKLKIKQEVLIGMNPWDCLPLIKYKKKIGAKWVVYFDKEFGRKRFDNFFMNFIYNSIDKYCARRADFIVCTTKRAMEKRMEEKVPEKKLIYVPIGVFLNEIGKIDLKGRTWQKKLVFVGDFYKEDINKYGKILKNSEVSLNVISEKRIPLELEKYRDEKGLRGKINFFGDLRIGQIIEYLKNFGGVGLIKDVENKNNYIFADVLEIKEYFACGVPVLTPNIGEISENIGKDNLGWVYNNFSELEKILEEINKTSWQEYGEMIEKILKMKNDIDIDKIMERFLKKIK